MSLVYTYKRHRQAKCLVQNRIIFSFCCKSLCGNGLRHKVFWDLFLFSAIMTFWQVHDVMSWVLFAKNYRWGSSKIPSVGKWDGRNCFGFVQVLCCFVSEAFEVRRYEAFSRRERVYRVRVVKATQSHTGLHSLRRTRTARQPTHASPC